MSSSSASPSSSPLDIEGSRSDLPTFSAAARVLIVDDDPMVRDGLRDILGRAGYTVTTAKDGKEALDRLEDEAPDLLLLDLKLPRLSGMDVLREIRDTHPEIPVVIVSGKGSIADAVEAIKEGAYDFLEKPVGGRGTLVTVNNALEAARLRRQRDRLLKEVKGRYEMVGSSEPMQRIYDRIDKAAQTSSTVLVTGESGTGKEMVARAIHHNSDREAGPFVTVNCAAIPPDLIESELFGHEEGAFTGAKGQRKGKFEQAGGGTLFLDEIADMSQSVQSKVLRAIEREEVHRVGGQEPIDVDNRMIAATNRDLKVAVEEGRFREDLYYRLNVIRIEVPPLRDRRGDIPELAEHFLTTISAENDQERKRLNAGAIQELVRYDWPGNVRELRNVIEQLLVLSEGSEIGAGAIQDAIGDLREAPATADAGLEAAREQFEKVYIRQALREHEGHIQNTASALGVDRSTLWRKMEKYGLQAD